MCFFIATINKKMLVSPEIHQLVFDMSTCFCLQGDHGCSGQDGAQGNQGQTGPKGKKGR